MLKSLISSLSNKNTELLRKLNSVQLGEIIMDPYLVQFVTQHVGVCKKSQKQISLNGSNFLKYLIGLHYKLIKNIIGLKEKRKNHITGEYQLLVYVPNEKYLKYIEAITDEINGKILIISKCNLKTPLDLININKLKVSGLFAFYLKQYLFFLIYPFFLAIKRNYRELAIVLGYRYLYYDFFLKNFLLSQFLKNIKSHKYFSLIPNGDLHRIIEIYHSHRFVNTFAIRPETMTDAEEHKYHISQNLFYKSLHEREIYVKYKIDNAAKLLRGSLMVKAEIRQDNKFTDKEKYRIVLFDTCTNDNPQSGKIRHKGLNEIYSSIASQLPSARIYHKFHPGLEIQDKKDTMQYLDQFRVKVIEDFVLTEYDFVITYYSTMMQSLILNKVPFVLLSENYNLDYGFRETETELDEAPVRRVLNKNDLADLLNQIALGKPLVEICFTNELHTWYTDYYHYPSGLFTIVEHLNAPI